MTKDQEIERLRDRVAELEELLGLPPVPLHIFKNVGAKPMQLLGLLAVRRGLVTREHIFRVLYGGLPEADQPTRLDVVNVHVARLNKHLRKRGAKIKSQHGGYYLDDKSRRVVRKMLKMEMAFLGFAAGAATVGFMTLGLGHWRSMRRKRQFDAFASALKRMYEEEIGKITPG